MKISSVTLREAHDKHLWLPDVRRALLFLSWSPLCMWMAVDIDSPGLCSWLFFFTSFPFSLVRQAKLFKASPITQFCFKGPSHKIMYDRIRHLPLKALPPCHVQLDLTLLCRASLTAWALTEDKVQVQNRSSRSREAEYSEASVDCGRSPRRNHWGRGRTSQCGQIFKAECKFPSLHSSK